MLGVQVKEESAAVMEEGENIMLSTLGAMLVMVRESLSVAVPPYPSVATAVQTITSPSVAKLGVSCNFLLVPSVVFCVELVHV